MSDRTDEQTERRDFALAALKAGHDADLREIGWHDVFSVVEAGWRIFGDDNRPVSRLPLNARIGWVSILGYHPTSAILQALRMWPATDQGSYCPKPADIAHLLTAGTSGPTRSNAPPELSPWRSPSVLLHVAGLIESGEPVCDCHPAPMTLVRSGDEVLRCAECGGLEYGQASEAIDHVLPEPDRPALAVVDDGRPAQRAAARAMGDVLRDVLAGERAA